MLTTELFTRTGSACEATCSGNSSRWALPELLAACIGSSLGRAMPGSPSAQMPVQCSCDRRFSSTHRAPPPTWHGCVNGQRVFAIEPVESPTRLLNKPFRALTYLRYPLRRHGHPHEASQISTVVSRFQQQRDADQRRWELGKRR